MKDAIKIAIEALQANQKSWKTLADSGDAGNWKAEEQPVWRQTEDALSIMRGLAEDADLLALFATSQKQLPLDAVISATPPQAQSSHAPNPSNINSLEAKTPDLVTPQAAPTEAQEREP